MGELGTSLIVLSQSDNWTGLGLEQSIAYQAAAISPDLIVPSQDCAYFASVLQFYLLEQGSAQTPDPLAKCLPVR